MTFTLASRLCVSDRKLGSLLRFHVPRVMSLALGGMLLSCANPPQADTAPLSAEETFQRLEAELLIKPEVRLGYRIESSGAFSASLEGELRLLGQSDVDLSGTGTFGDAQVELRLESAAGVLRGGSSALAFEEPVPEHLRQAIVIGFTRMGLLHNLARLSAARAPDHASGGVEEWVQPRHLVYVERPPDGASPLRGLAFEIEVAGQNSGEAELWLDAHGQPVRRQQIVRFPGGEFRVVEEYRILTP